jgi:hypothetical protein
MTQPRGTGAALEAFLPAVTPVEQQSEPFAMRPGLGPN